MVLEDGRRGEEKEEGEKVDKGNDLKEKTGGGEKERREGEDSKGRGEGLVEGRGDEGFGQEWSERVE